MVLTILTMMLIFIIITLDTNVVNLFDAVLKLAQRRDSDNTTPDRA